MEKANKRPVCCDKVKTAVGTLTYLFLVILITHPLPAIS